MKEAQADSAQAERNITNVSMKEAEANSAQAEEDTTDVSIERDGLKDEESLAEDGVISRCSEMTRRG